MLPPTSLSYELNANCHLLYSYKLGYLRRWPFEVIDQRKDGWHEPELLQVRQHTTRMNIDGIVWGLKKCHR